ncbi:MAG: NAD(P)H-hydrate dehydratase [Syntrophobacteraceae bacterium]
MLTVVGTVPDPEFPLLWGRVSLDRDRIIIGGRRVHVNRGTPALLAAACSTLDSMGQPAPFAYLVGDIGLGRGSRLLYEHLVCSLDSSPDSDTFAFHYLQPDVDWHNRVLFALELLPERPRLIADAGFMYAAKMSGMAPEYDLFTPDVGELAFLADENAPHPFYTRGFILHEDNRVPELAARAYLHDNAARWLLIKGARDYLADRSGIRGAVDHPVEEALEAIGGTGDTLTGIVAALISTGLEIEKAALIAAHANRLAGSYARPTPATQISEIIGHVSKAVEELLKNETVF